MARGCLGVESVIKDADCLCDALQLKMSRSGKANAISNMGECRIQFAPPAGGGKIQGGDLRGRP